VTQPPAPTYTQPPVPAGGNPWAVKYSLGRAVGYAILSFGLWTYWWFYKTRELFNRELGKTDESAVLYTLGLLVPILNFFIIYWLWRDLGQLRVRVGLSETNATLYLILLIVGIFIPFLPIIVYILVLNEVNEYWDVRSQGAATDAPFEGGEKVLVFIGVGLWILFIFIWILVIVVVVANN
jgi:hypothetical protein